MGGSLGSGNVVVCKGHKTSPTRVGFLIRSENPMVCKDRKTAPICSIAAHVYYKPMRLRIFFVVTTCRSPGGSYLRRQYTDGITLKEERKRFQDIG